MNLLEKRAQIIASIWQAIAQSKIDLSSISGEDQDKLVSKIADQVIVSVDDLLEDEIEQEPPPTQEVIDNGIVEKVIWQGRPLLSLVEHYTITNERIKIVHGVIGKGIENFELVRIQDIDLKQGIGERMLGVGDIAIRGSDVSKPSVTLRNVRQPEEVYEFLRKAWLEARKRHGLQFREYM
jgi:hypothetical protein